MKHIYYGKIDLKTKIRALNCYVSSIFLYSSELWSITSKIAKSINAFHHRLLGTSCLNIHWTITISNEKLYDITNGIHWSIAIKKTTTKLVWLYDSIAVPQVLPYNTPAN